MSSAGAYIEADDDNNPANVAKRKRKLGVLLRLRALMAPYVWRFVLALVSLLGVGLLLLGLHIFDRAEGNFAEVL